MTSSFQADTSPAHTSQTSSDHRADDMLQFDREHIWHPYSSTTNPTPVFAVDSAKGVRLTLKGGQEIIDGMASWWSVIHGYNHPRLNDAAKQQIDTMSHVMFGGLTHQPAVDLCKKLVELSPKPLNKVFLSDSGSVAVEVAIKMALQYWAARSKPEKNKLITLRSGYHGDTFATMAVCDPETGMHHLFTSAINQHFFVNAPKSGFKDDIDPAEIEALRQTIEQNHQQLAAFILEPIVQGAGGMRFYNPQYLREVRALCDEFDLLLIHDEIATGFGRTGTLFACEHANISPDIMCVGKALTAGYMSLAATLCTDHIADTISEGEAGVFMHGPTFMGNPLACAIANTSLELLLEQDWQSNIKRINQGLLDGLAPAKNLDQVADVRCLGAIGVIELKEPVDMTTAQPKFVEAGVWIRPFGKLVYTMPPYIISEQDIATLCGAMVSTVAQL